MHESDVVADEDNARDLDQGGERDGGPSLPLSSSRGGRRGDGEKGEDSQNECKVDEEGDGYSSKGDIWSIYREFGV